jgi:hypothetical protein
MFFNPKISGNIINDNMGWTVGYNTAASPDVVLCDPVGVVAFLPVFVSINLISLWDVKIHP